MPKKKSPKSDGTEGRAFKKLIEVRRQIMDLISYRNGKPFTIPETRKRRELEIQRMYLAEIELNEAKNWWKNYEYEQFLHHTI